MKKIIFYIVISLIMLTFNVHNTNAQTQHGSWILSHDDLMEEISQIIFNPNSITMAHIAWNSGILKNSAGGYNQNNGDLLFYVLNNKLYDKNSNFVGQYVLQNGSKMSAEVQIINKPGTNNQYYIISSFLDLSEEENGYYYYTEVEVDLNTGNVSYQEAIDFQSTDNRTGFALTEEVNGQRYIYVSSKNIDIQRHTVTNSGISEIPVEIVNKSNTLIDGNFDAHNFELKINEDDETILAWINVSVEKLFVVNIDEYMNVDIYVYDINLGRMGGIEFSPVEDNVIYISCSDDQNGGIIKYDYVDGLIINPPLTINGEYGRTFLQQAPDGHIYAVSNNGMNIGRIEMPLGNFYTNVLNIGRINTHLTYDEMDFFILPENSRSFEPLNLTFFIENVTCPGDCDGYVTAQASGGTPPYTYEWFDQGISIGTSDEIYDLCEGEYTCCVTDALEFIFCESFEIIVDPNLYTDLTWWNVSTTVSPSNLNKSFKEGIWISNNAVLTLTDCYFEFGKDAKVIIEPGSELVLDNSVLTNLDACDDMWLGVEVWGTLTESQYECQGELHQGKIIIRNSGTIENAEIGVLLGARDLNAEGDFNDDKAGGIIQVLYGGHPQVQDAYFKNNKWAVRFWKYQNFTVDPVTCENLMPAENLSFLQNCTFDINTDYFGGQWWYSHVHLFDVNGIDFYGCTFENNYTTTPSGHGINAWGAGFTVKAICNSQQAPCPEEDLDKCTFTFFKKAINNHSSGTHTIYVSDADFFNNSYGIQLNNVNNATILFNDFFLGEPIPCGMQEDAAFGIDLNSCTGFALEENYFTKAQGAPRGNYIGIRVNECPSEWDIIYKNSFEGLSYGNYAQGTNRENPNNDEHGVEYQCNTNSTNAVDFIVTGDEPEIAMIRTEQGSQDVASGNTFSEIAAWHYRNEGLQYINYFYCEGCPNEEPDMNRVYTTNGLPLFDPDPTNENTCPSHYGGGGGGTDGRTLLTGDEKLNREQMYTQNYSDYENVKALYDNLQDGGNTEALQTEIELSWPDDMWELRAELLGKSPHLSKEVLMTAADKTDVLPESVLFEILSANPDELKKAELISYLENKEQPLPQYMIDILKQLTYGVTYKTILKRQMTKYHAAKSQAALDMIRSILADSVLDIQQYRNWLDNLGGLSADKQIVTSYISEDNFTDAQAMLDLLPSLYNLEGDVLTNYNDYKAITQMQIDWKQQGKNIYELDSLEVTSLQDYAENSQGSARNIARGILNFAYGYNYCDCPVISDSSFMKSSRIFPSESFKKMYEPEIKVKPNPAGDWTTFYYELPDNSSEGIIEITDVSGSVVKTFTVNRKQGQQLWDTRKINSGVYLYTMKANGFNKSGKIIISK